MSGSSVLVAVVAVLLLAGAIALLRSPSALPWRAIGLAVLTASVCVTIGGDAPTDESSGPSLILVVGMVVGFVSAVATILALIPRDPENARPSRLPILLASAATVVGVAGLLIDLMVT